MSKPAFFGAFCGIFVISVVFIAAAVGIYFLVNMEAKEVEVNLRKVNQIGKFENRLPKERRVFRFMFNCSLTLNQFKNSESLQSDFEKKKLL